MFARANHGANRDKGTRSFFLKMLALVLVVTQIATSGLFVKHTYGATVNQGTVKVRSANVRKDPSSSSQVAFCVASNESVAILGEEKGKDGNTWLKIAVGNSTGYIRSDLVTSTDKKITVNDSLVPKKVQESSSSVKSDSSAANNSSTTSNTSDNSMASFANSGIIKGTSVRVRKEANTTSGIVAVLDKGDFVIVSGEGKGSDGQTWYQIKTGNATGFVRSDLLSKATVKQTTTNTANEDSKKTETSDNTASDDSVNGDGAVKGTYVRIRKSASLTGEILTSVSEGTTLHVVGKATGSDKNWYKVTFNKDGAEVTGFISADYVTLTEKVSENAQAASQETTTKPEENTDENTQSVEQVQTTPEIQTQNVASGTSASIKGIGVRIREVPVTGNVICQLSTGHPVLVTGDTAADDGHKWYQIAFSYQGSNRTGYVRDDFVTATDEITETAPLGDEEFEASIAALPESYKNSLRALHQKHPNWRFEAVDTGLDWSASLLAESSVGKNLVSKNAIASWKSTAAQAYNWNANTWYTFDGGSWASASPELIAYYMDPRNFLNESGIYQFEKLDYSESQKKEGVSKMLTGTFMSGEFTDADGETSSYADVFAAAGQLLGVSPYLLAGRCIQEQGITGKSNSIVGNVPGYEGYYNYYNIGAYAYSGRSATINGLIYAMGSDEENARPWNTRKKSIFGGAKFIADKYVSKGQNTLYFQKFNVVNRENVLYSHQYMNNVQAASSESARLQLAYLGDDEPLTFRIPFYQNMPANKCAKPTSDSNPNSYLGALSVDGYELSPAFSGATDTYVVNVDAATEYININATAVVPSSAVGGTGTFQINPGTNMFTVGCKAQNGAVKTYTIYVQR